MVVIDLHTGILDFWSFSLLPLFLTVITSMHLLRGVSQDVDTMIFSYNIEIIDELILVVL